MTRSLVTRLPRRPDRPGLPPASDFRSLPYHSSFSLDAIGQPQVGRRLAVRSAPGVVGGVSMLFGDQLSDRQIFAAIQANGTVKDIGGAVQYYNLKNRWNWGGGVEHIPYLTGERVPADTIANRRSPAAYSVNQIARSASTSIRRCCSHSIRSRRRKRLELSGERDALRLRYRELQDGLRSSASPRRQNDSTISVVLQAGLHGRSRRSRSSATIRSPRSRRPWKASDIRIQYTPTFGSVTYQTATVDYRRYFFMRPFTLAFRGISLGRYGSGAEDVNSTFPIYLGEETLMRGYGYGSFTQRRVRRERWHDTAGAVTAGCPVFDRLFGSKVAVVNAELRIPLFGTEGFGLINFPFLPTEIAPFFDAGVSYTNEQGPDFRLATHRRTTSRRTARRCRRTSRLQQQQAYYPCADRIPVFSTGVSMRFNLMGYAILEAYAAHPFQRPTKNWVWGFQLAPGW